ncbi:MULTISPECIES: MauE/DoxX family redox-associated membrane protein [unclassified Streptomyces]|uniref:MauE/DoxX family redox-associated membrane protein n=1 Tax=unclassified Streptomyces TaxID=2593676 RepID=UPI002E18DBF1
MSEIVFFAAAARISVAGVLIVSAAAKMRSPTMFRSVLRELGVPATRTGWAAMCAGELFIAGLVLLPVDSMIPAVATAALGVLFAAAGLYVLRSSHAVQCACFGAGSTKQLGRPQLIALPMWLLAALAITRWQPSGQSESTALAAVVLVVVLAVHLVPLVRAVRSAQGDRIAVAETEGSHA